MPKTQELSVCDKLLLAAHGLERGGNSPFSAEDLVVGAWKRFPDTFGLRGHLDEHGKPAYPDSNRVFAEIMGSKPIRKRGLLVKVGIRMYTLTESGRDFALRLQATPPDAGDAGQKPAKSTLSRDIQQELQRLLATKAVQRIDNGQIETVTFHHACVFWGINPRSSAIELEGRLANTTRVINAARSVVKGGSVQFEHGGKEFSSDSLDLLERVQLDLQGKFERELKTIMKRVDQRRV